jgi:hypothetical protein
VVAIESLAVALQTQYLFPDRGAALATLRRIAKEERLQ